MKAVLAPLLLTACVETVMVPGTGEIRECSADGAQSLVGRKGDEALGKEAMKRTGSGVIRWIRPDEPVTMDFRTDRLNIELDERDRVIAFSCG